MVALVERLFHLFKGADSSEQQASRKYILQYLKGSNTQKQQQQLKSKLKSNMPELYTYFEQVWKIWKIRKSHMLKDLPPQYAFHLVCCFDPSCTHPLCVQGSSKQ